MATITFTADDGSTQVFTLTPVAASEATVTEAVVTESDGASETLVPEAALAEPAA